MYIITDATSNQVVNIAHAPTQLTDWNPGDGLTATWLDDSKASTVPANWSACTYKSGAFAEIPPTLDEAKAAQLALIEQAYQAVMAAGFSSSADTTARTYASDPESLQELGWVRGVAESAYPTDGLPAKLVDGSPLHLTYTQMQQLITDGQTFYITNKTKVSKLQQAIQAAQTVPDVQAIV